MLTVRTGAGSPFGRKVRIAVSVLGLDDKVRIDSASTQDASDPIRQQNPLGKIPVLLLEDGTAFFDSPVILEYLDMLAGGGRIIPKDAKARFDALRLEALADGILDASILRVYEVRHRPEERREPSWVAYQEGKVMRGLAMLHVFSVRRSTQYSRVSVVKSLYLLARGLEADIRAASENGPAVLLSVTAMGGTMGFGTDLPADFSAGHGGVAGFTKCLGYEWPEVTVRVDQ